METKSIPENRLAFWQTSDYRKNGEDDDSTGRKAWFARIVALYRPTSILELGCNEGSNLRRIRQLLPHARIAAIEINPEAADTARKTVEGATIITGSIYDAEKYFKEKEFDLVFTMGVVMHIPPSMTASVAEQATRLAKDVILHCEEYSNEETERRWDDHGTPHRWSHNFLNMYADLTPTHYRRIVGRGGGAEDLVIVSVNGKRNGLRGGALAYIALWWLCCVLPLINVWKTRIALRWKLRGLFRFFLP